MFHVYLIFVLNFDSGHHIVQIRLIFRAIPSRWAPYAPGTDLFLTYAQRFDIVPQLDPTAQASSTQRGQYPDPSTGMYVLKRSERSDRTIMGDIVPLRQVRALIDKLELFLILSPVLEQMPTSN